MTRMLLVALVLLAGCATGGDPLNEARAACDKEWQRATIYSGNPANSPACAGYRAGLDEGTKAASETDPRSPTSCVAQSFRNFFFGSTAYASCR